MKNFYMLINNENYKGCMELISFCYSLEFPTAIPLMILHSVTTAISLLNLMFKSNGFQVTSLMSSYVANIRGNNGRRRGKSSHRGRNTTTTSGLELNGNTTGKARGISRGRGGRSNGGRGRARGGRGQRGGNYRQFPHVLSVPTLYSQDLL